LAYKRLCITFHPDKHSSEQQIASKRFRLIQDAYSGFIFVYKVLSDDNKRHLYDLYGIQDSWDVGPKLKSKEQVL
jgi:DnaJ-class molecular chaperone